jgi:predicted XRE-type DNA-binding protein
MNDKNPEAVVGSGNLFADLGFTNANEMLAKAELARQIAGIVTGRDLTQTEAARLLCTPQSGISDLLRGRLEGFSLAGLIRFLNALEELEIVDHH